MTLISASNPLTPYFVALGFPHLGHPEHFKNPTKAALLKVLASLRSWNFF
jgi:hypothetical protein